MIWKKFFAFTLIASAICNVDIKAQSTEPPDLIVLIAVDQMRQDFFDRFGQNFNGGLKRIMDQGVMYTNAHHPHGLTNTGPGHATISTGKYPSQHGIVNNSFYNTETHSEIYCVEDRSEQVIGVDNNGSLPARSPRNLKASTIGDWFKKTYSGSRVYSVSRKDRTAVLLGGHSADMAFWFDNVSTKFVTSTYYSRDYPAWADKFIGKEMMAEDLEKGWYKYAPEETYSALRADDFPVEAGAFYADFPHTRVRMRQGIPPTSRDAIMLTTTPIADHLVLKFAREVIEQENLGKGGSPDMLMVGCSAADAIGHHFGPESHEVMDYYLYLDQYLGEFFDYLDQRYGKEKYWIVFTSDHGVNPMPEALKMQGIDAERILNSDIGPMLDSLEGIAQKELGLQGLIIEEIMGGIFLNYLESDARGITRTTVRKTIAKLLESLPFIVDTYTVDELKSRRDKPYIEPFRRSYYDEISPDIMFRLKEYYMIHGPYGTSHGSVYGYDSHVPVVFCIPGFEPAKIDREVHTTDIAPTMAAMLDIKADRKVDGQVLSEMLSPR